MCVRTVAAMCEYMLVRACIRVYVYVYYASGPLTTCTCVNFCVKLTARTISVFVGVECVCVCAGQTYVHVWVCTQYQRKSACTRVVSVRAYDCVCVL